MRAAWRNESPRSRAHRSATATLQESLGLAWLIPVALMLLVGCATGLKREGQCLASLTPDYLDAQTELERLEASWRAVLRRQDVALNRPSTKAPVVVVADTLGVGPRTSEILEAGEAYRRLLEARTRHQPTLLWYGRVYERWRTRLDEEQILSEVRMILLPGPGVVFYPVIRWNIHAVFWDGADPDADSDPITRFCTDRLAQAAGAADVSMSGTE